MHGFAAGMALTLLALYADRSGWLYNHGTQSRWALVTRIGIAGLLGSIMVGFVTLSADRAPFELRHWLVLGSMMLAIVGHLGLRRGGHTNPT